MGSPLSPPLLTFEKRSILSIETYFGVNLPVSSSKMIAAVKSLYSNIASRVRLNGHYTDWFAVKTGLRQGYALSTILFNLYINDLALLLKSSHRGINIDNEDICVLNYADDIVLIA